MIIKKWIANNLTVLTLKKVFVMLLVCVVVTSFFPSVEKAEAEVIYQKMGIVTCTNVSIRKDPDTRAGRYTRLENGAPVMIVGEWDKDWYIIDLNYLGLGEGQGYALKKYIATNTYNIVLNESAILWADPFGSGIANGEKTKGTIMLVLAETKDWFVVQTRESSAGSSFIRKAGLDYTIAGDDENLNSNTSGNINENNGQSNLNTNNNLYVVTARTLAVRSEADDNEEAVGFLHNGDVVKVIKYGDYFTSIEYVMAGQITECWVHTRYLKKIYK